MLTVLLLFLSLQSISSTNPDDSLPVYMRGVNWGKVQEFLKDDLRLPDTVTPLNYAIELSVNVRDYEGAERSNFNGTVTIALNFTKSTDRIELHSNGLNIEKVALLEWIAMEPPPSVTKFSLNKHRETMMIHPNRTIKEGEEFMLQITYSGLAIMNEYGLYENWDPKFNITQSDQNGSFVLVTNNYPTGARCWFPCFDEPERRATFDLRVNHPKTLNVYSNTELIRMESDKDSKIMTSIFEKTRPLSTYQLTLSVNHFPVDNLGKLHGFNRVRVISSLNNPEARLEEIQRDIININLQYLRNSTPDLYDHFNGNLDVIILDGTQLVTVNPGLVTFGRYNYLPDLMLHRLAKVAIPPTSILTNLIVGNHISVRSVDQLWVNDMFAIFFAEESSNKPITHMGQYFPRDFFYSSAHERPLRDSSNTFATTTKQFLIAKKQERTLKASQLLKVIHRLCPAARKAFEKYLSESRGKFADIDRLVETVSHACKSEDIRNIMNDFINKPGRAFLTVSRNNGKVEIRQSRYLSTGFNEKLRDTKTRYTIPIFVTVDGEESVKILRKNEASLTLSVKENSTFILDNQYDRLYFVFYKDVLHYNNVTEDAREQLQHIHKKSLLAGLEQGALKYDEFVEHARHYVIQKVFRSDNIYFLFEQAMWAFAFDSQEEVSVDTHKLVYLSNHCAYLMVNRDYRISWDGLFNNDTSQYWHYKLDFDSLPRIYLADDWNMARKISCLLEWRNSTTYLEFLGKNFFGDSTQIRPSLMKYLKVITEADGSQWKELHQFFYRNVNNFTDPRWNMLADLVLNSRTINYNAEDYSNKLREFVSHHPRRAASMSNEIEMKMEKEYIRRERVKWFGVEEIMLHRARNELTDISPDIMSWKLTIVGRNHSMIITQKQD